MTESYEVFLFLVFSEVCEKRMARETEIPDTDSVLAKEVGDKGILELNRPKSLNAINYEMAQKITAVMNIWQNKKMFIIIKGNGGRAFSAGGDVKSYVTAKDPFEAGKKVFRLMWRVLQIIENMSIPWVALIDGIVMGGAAGLAMNGKYRIATEKTIFAMPEVTIGNRHHSRMSDHLEIISFVFNA